MSDVPPRLLREMLHDQPALEPSSACLDAETLAAWFDGTLSRRERAAAELHASTCARCQAVLAATAKTAAPSQVGKWWQTPIVRWLVPIAATAAAAVVLWVKTPEQRQAVGSRRPEQPAAFVDAPASVAAPVTPSAAAPPPPSARRIDRPADSKDAKARETREHAQDKRTSSQGVDSFATPQERIASETPLERDAIVGSSAPAAARARSAAPSSSAPPASALAESAAVQFKQAAKETAPPEILSPDRNIRWRIQAGGNVERSTDGGATWQRQSTGATTMLTGGFAPAATVCWLIGPAGTVLLSTDGRTWQRAAFPEAVDLVSIRASDGVNATVSAADGRTFTTSDGGKTWRLP